MVYIFYVNAKRRLKESIYSQLIEQVPVVCQTRIKRFHRWQDAQRSLLGLHVLRQGLKNIDASYSLNSIEYAANGKPFLKLPVNFSISHAGAISLCAVSSVHAIGIDCEEIIDKPLSDFKSQFTSTEWNWINGDQADMRRFYTCWTRKEALLKATGQGLTTDLSVVNTKADHIKWEEQSWYWYPISIHPDYVVSLACNTAHAQLQIKEVVLEGYKAQCHL